MPDIVIIGNGPAGITAAIYALRAGMETVVIGKDMGSLQNAGVIENYYGFPEPVEGKQLILNGIEQAKRLGAKIVEDEVLGLSYMGRLIVRAKNTEFESDALVIATGSSRSKPELTGIKEFEGSGVSYCATCDAFFYKKKDVAVLGNGEYAVSEAKELAHVASSVTILTNGEPMQAEVPENISVNKKQIERLEGAQKLECVKFKDGTLLSVSGAFVAMGVAGSSELARMMGVQLSGSDIVVSETMQTNVPGVFAAGDCTGGWMQVGKAVYEGAKAGFEAVKYVRKKKGDANAK
jgi:thioredoxin reductase (NADPH)